MKNRHRPSQFDLELAVESYLKKSLDIDTSKSVGSTGLQQKLKKEVEILVSIGLSPREAFEVSKIRFGLGKVKNHQKVPGMPKKVIHQYLFSGLITFFTLQLIWMSADFISKTSIILIDIFRLSPSYLPALDLGLKLTIIVALIHGVAQYLKKGKLKKYYLGMIPMVYLLSGFIFSHYQNIFLHQYNHITSDIKQLFMTNSKIAFISMAVLLIAYMLFSCLRNSPGKNLSNR